MASSLGNDNNNGDHNNNTKEEEEEFRLRFNWMRPHPSLVFSLQEDAAAAAAAAATKTATTREEHHVHRINTKEHPAVVNSQMIHTYRDAIIMKHQKQQQHEMQIRKDEENEEVLIEEEVEPSDDDINGNYDAIISSSATTLPYELPSLCVDLESLVEPPLMTSWLPTGEGDP